MIQKKKKICAICKKESFIFSRNKCKSCVSKEDSKPLKKISEKGIEKKKLKTEKTKVLHQFFLDLWDERSDKDGNIRCFETDILMSHTVYKHNSCCYSHQISKSKCPQYALDKENILIVLPNVHANWESNQELCPKMLAYTIKLKKKYGIN